MKKAERKDFGKPDEVREFPKGKLELIKIGGATIGRAVFEPGWRWVTSVQPLAKTKSCEAPHFQYHVSGVLRIRMDDGTEFDCKPGDVSLLPSGHEAAQVLKEVILPSFDMLLKLEAEKKILAGGLPVGDRAFVFMVEAASNDEVDQLLRNIPMWGSLDWEVTPLQTFAGRADMERAAIKALKKASK